jgi:uncharacterized membrane protein
VSEAALSRGDAPRRARMLAAVRGRVWADAGEAAVALRVVYAGIAAYAALFVFAAVLHYLVFLTPRPDLGGMVQAIHNTLHGHFLETTTLSGHQVDRLGVHVDPFLVLLAPLYWIWSTPLLLPVLQALAVASGALPVFWLARKHLASSRAGAHFAFAYLLYPATQFNAFTIAASFHPLSMAVPLVLYAVWFLDEDRLVAFSCVALLACTTNEVVPLAVGCLGIWYALRRGRRLFGLGVFAAGLAITAFDFLWVIPHVAPNGVNPFAGRYRAVGGTPSGIAHKLFTDPMAFVHAVASAHKAVFLALLLIPFLGLWLLEPLLLLGALPALAINLLSSWGNQTSITYEDTAAIVPFVVAASIFGAARFKGRGDQLSLWALAGAAAVAVYSPIYTLPKDVHALSTPLVAAKSHAVGLVPAGVPVSASDQLGGHLSERRYSYTFPVVGRSRWIVVDVNDPTYADAAGFKRSVRKYEADKAWRIVFSSQGVAVLHRLAGRATG